MQYKYDFNVLDSVFLLKMVFNGLQTGYNFKILTFQILDLNCFKESQLSSAISSHSMVVTSFKDSFSNILSQILNSKIEATARYFQFFLGEKQFSSICYFSYDISIKHSWFLIN
jgi:hypothetical protein